MEIVWLNWFLLIGIFSMALASPGPDFVIVVRNSILYSRQIGFFTAIGFALGVCVHVTYTLFGIAAIIAQSVFLFNLLKYAGAAYLFYIGIKALRSQGFQTENNSELMSDPKNQLSAHSALWSGFLTNVLNPKATIFFMAVFSQFVGPETSFITQIIYASTCVVLTAIWFSLVALVLTNPKIKAGFLKFTKWIDRVCGGLLVALGIKLALSKAV